MAPLTRRTTLGLLAAQALATRVHAAPATPASTRFSDRTVAEIAADLATRPYDPVVRPLPDAVKAMDWDAWRQIVFRPEQSLLAAGNSSFRLQAFHVGHLFTRAIQLHAVNGDYSAPIAYDASEFHYGPNRFDPPLPGDLGFAGWRINHPVNKPGVYDELVSFLGASYFRFLGQGQSYGLSARGLSIGTGLLDNNEEFPAFKSFWFEPPTAEAITFHALLDGPSLAGAYRFILRPGAVSTMDVRAELFPRRAITELGVAPLTSMFFMGENDRHMNDRNRYDDYRPEMHDSDGLMLHTADGQWIWRPLTNPQIQQISHFHLRDIRGFGLIQRDRQFSHYQDIELAYQARPSYWIEPIGDWGEGRIELIELATRDETADNIIAAWMPAQPTQGGKPVSYEYRISSALDLNGLNSLGKVIATFHAPTGALGSRERREPGSRRFLVDFAGPDLDAWRDRPHELQLDVKVAEGRYLRGHVAPHPDIKGVRAFIDVQGQPSQPLYATATLRQNGKAVTETWNYRWKAE